MGAVAQKTEKTWLESIVEQAPKMLEELKELVDIAEDSFTNKSGKNVDNSPKATWQAWTYNLGRIETKVAKLKNLPFAEDN